MRKPIASLLLALAASAQADTAECERHMLTTYPFPHRQSAEQAKALKDCNPDNLYYGIGVHFDYVKARHCAFAKESHDVLMMLYANGLGMPRNYTVAKMAACRSDASAPELEARLARLARMQTGREGSSPKIDICDDAAESKLLARCEAIRQDLAGQEVDARVDTLSARWSDAEKAALERVRSLAERSQAGQEVLDALLEFEAGKLPALSAADAARAEKDLEQLKVPADVLRAWQAYRDAWLALAKLRYPSVPPHALKAYFARKRIAAADGR